jgi:membrane associated rhomboid family serine protease
LSEVLAAFTGGAPASALVLAAIVAASTVGLWLAPALIERNLFRPHYLVARHAYATLVTSGFIHADLAHLLFNAFTFWAFAFALERRIGSARFLALFFLALVAGNLGTWLRHRGDAQYRSLGASGAILGVLFASIVYAPGQSIFVLPFPVPIPAPLFALAYLGFTLYASRQARGRINHDAHLAGALAGLAFVAITDPQALARAAALVFR